MNHTCSFCGKDQDHTDLIVTGPGVCICGECIKLCEEIRREHQATMIRREALETAFEELWGTDV